MALGHINEMEVIWWLRFLLFYTFITTMGHTGQGRQRNHFHDISLLSFLLNILPVGRPYPPAAT